MTTSLAQYSSCTCLQQLCRVVESHNAAIGSVDEECQAKDSGCEVDVAETVPWEGATALRDKLVGAEETPTGSPSLTVQVTR